MEGGGDGLRSRAAERFSRPRGKTAKGDPLYLWSKRPAGAEMKSGGTESGGALRAL